MKTVLAIIVILCFVFFYFLGNTVAKNNVAKGVLACEMINAYGKNETICYNPKKCDLNGCSDKSTTKRKEP